jgi:hypothetical protein
MEVAVVGCFSRPGSGRRCTDDILRVLFFALALTHH